MFEAILSLKKIKDDKDEILVGNKNCDNLVNFFNKRTDDDDDLRILKDFILTCLEPDYKLRPSPSDLLLHKFICNLNLEIDDHCHFTSNYYRYYNLFSEKINNYIEKENNIEEKSNNENLIINENKDNAIELEKLQPKVIFYLWRLAGGDLEYEFIKQELISLPSIYRVRNASQIYYSLKDDLSENVINNKNCIQQSSNPENLFQDKKIILYLDTLISKFNEYKKSNNDNFLIDQLKNDSIFYISKNGINQEKDLYFNDFMDNNKSFVDFWSSFEIINV